MELDLLAIIFVSVALGALVKGLAGFGFGILGTALLVNFMPTRQAITVMIIPLLAVNIPLIFEAEFKHLKSCLNKYKLFVSLGILGSFLGVLLVDFLPIRTLSVLVGSVAIGYVYLKQDILWKPKGRIVSKCFTDKSFNQSWIGVFSGTAFGATNIGLPFVIYLERLDTDRETFIGLLSLIILTATLVRTTYSYFAGFYIENLLLVSIVAGLFGLLVSEGATKISHKIPSNYLEILTLFMILVAGLRVLITNLGF